MFRTADTYRAPATLVVTLCLCMQLLAAVTMNCCVPALAGDQDMASQSDNMAMHTSHHEHHRPDDMIADDGSHASHDANACLFCALSHHGNPLAYQQTAAMNVQHTDGTWFHQLSFIPTSVDQPWRPPA